MIMTIIDCHIHPGVNPATQTNYFGVVGDFNHQIELLRKAGVTKACGSVIQRLETPSFSDIKALNDEALRLRDQHPDFYIPAIHVHPRHVHESIDEVERCCGEHGVRWIGELVGYHMGFGDEYDTEGFLSIMAAVEHHGAVVNIHCANLDVVESLCAAVPKVSFVLAHPGGGKDLILSRLERVATIANLHLDLSGSGIDRFGVVRKAIDVAGKEKILFGSDFPINNPAVYTGGMELEPLTEEERNAVFHENFVRLTEDDQ